jgi:hypothetical protein
MPIAARLFRILWFLDKDIGSSTCAGILEHSMGG